MKDIDRALADISDMRNQLAAGTMFRGFGPAVMALSGGLAALTAVSQLLWPDLLAADHTAYTVTWLVTAVLAGCFISAEVYARSHRHHGGLADTIVLNAFEQFLPAGFAGLAATLVIWKFAPDALWTLPGLWQVFLALGIFAGARSLDRWLVFCLRLHRLDAGQFSAFPVAVADGRPVHDRPAGAGRCPALCLWRISCRHKVTRRFPMTDWTG